MVVILNADSIAVMVAANADVVAYTAFIDSAAPVVDAVVASWLKER